MNDTRKILWMKIKISKQKKTIDICIDGNGSHIDYYPPPKACYESNHYYFISFIVHTSSFIRLPSTKTFADNETGNLLQQRRVCGW